MEPPAKGRRGHTFTHTERASVATFNLSNRTNQIPRAYAMYTHADTQICRYIDIQTYIYTHTYINTHLYAPRYINNN